MRIPWRAVVQMVVLGVVVVLARTTSVFEDPVGQTIAAVVLVVVGIDIVWMYWRRYGV